MSLKSYSYWQLGAIQNDLTPLTLRITEDSAKQLMISLIFTEICMIGLLGEWNVSYVSPAHTEIVHFFEIKATGSSEKLLQHYCRDWSYGGSSWDNATWGSFLAQDNSTWIDNGTKSCGNNTYLLCFMYN